MVRPGRDDIEGRFSEATTSFQKSLEIGRTAGIPSRVRADLMALQGIAALRRGEVDNCIGCVGAVELHLPDRARPFIFSRRARATRSNGLPRTWRSGQAIYAFVGC